MVAEWMGRAAGATRIDGRYLGTMATVVDAEEVRVAMAWERCDTGMVVLDSQGAIQRIYNLMSQGPRPWIGETRARSWGMVRGSGEIHMFKGGRVEVVLCIVDIGEGREAFGRPEGCGPSS